MNRLNLILILLLSFSWAFAQKSKQINPSDLDFGTNISVPEVPEKQALSIRSHMNVIRDAISRLGFNTEFRRDNEVVTVIIPCSDLFPPNSTQLKASGKAKLQHLAKFLQYPTMYKIVVAVYSDETGEPSYCDNLTSLRANNIDDHLTDIATHNKFPPANVIPYGMGQAEPRVDNLSMENRAINRRVEISIIPEWEMIETARAGKLK